MNQPVSYHLYSSHRGKFIAEIPTVHGVVPRVGETIQYDHNGSVYKVDNVNHRHLADMRSVIEVRATVLQAPK